MRPLHINLVAFLAVFVSVTVDAQYPVTYGCVAQILAYSPMNKLNTFVTNLNKDATLAAKKKRANSWVPNNLGSHKFPALDLYATSAKALEAVTGLLDHRNTVGLFWADLQPGLTKVYNASISKKYKNMWAKTDKIHDNAFFDALNEWYAYCHYNSPAGKRTALYNAIQKVTTKYANNTQLNYEVMSSAWYARFTVMMLFGSW
ncbi:SCP domain-containing protein [Caenorhabditis elegans]|uniref:SCP domain-containing protein n=1 Tax=Caenorhabditis elegans TaxID=6239 RepID=Q95XI6_CAEEL|nr:SCP domain-containing protein [Caenorhabditis elegans]CCD74126.1 SCP domain-containing protein [Caenorhabditis elegans]|eukprot:NP_500217.2 Uncharacterized protein CELE_Y69A2AR.22 [Caenorhabditis elegans]